MRDRTSAVEWLLPHLSFILIEHMFSEGGSKFLSTVNTCYLLQSRYYMCAYDLSSKWLVIRFLHSLWQRDEGMKHHAVCSEWRHLDTQVSSPWSILGSPYSTPSCASTYGISPEAWAKSTIRMEEPHSRNSQHRKTWGNNGSGGGQAGISHICT